MKRSLLILVSSLGLAACAAVPGQETALPGDLAPIARDHRGWIAAWAGRHGLREELRGALISDPLLIRDSTGRLLWLACLDLDPSRREPAGLRPRLHAFGFAPNYTTAPLERAGSPLNWEICTEHPLAWRPFQVEARRAYRRRR